MTAESIFSIAQVIAIHVPKIGTQRATALATAFGANTLDTLRREPAVAMQVAGVTTEHVEALRTWFISTRDVT